MQIIKGRKIVDDHWRHVADDQDIPAGLDVIVTLARWTRDRDQLLQRPGGLGVRLGPAEPPELIADDLGHFQVIALDFPAFTDGRAYTHARKLRERYGYRGEVRAVGDVLRDQLSYMHRCGFDAMEVRTDRSIENALEAFTEFSVTYQPTVN
ncbi:MAG: DUF934 domain-containing protein [Sphingomonadales bacterium]